MANKPTEGLDWVGTQSTATTGKKTAGFAVSERPGAQLFNWILGLISAWILYLREGIFRNNGDASNVTLSAGFADVDGNVRHFFDSSGILGGRVYQKEYHFEFAHKDEDLLQELLVPVTLWQPDEDASQWELDTILGAAGPPSWFASNPITDSDVLAIPIPLKKGQRIRQVNVYIDAPSGGTWDLTLFSCDRDSIVDRSVIATGSTAGSAYQPVTLIPTVPYEIQDNEDVYVTLLEGTDITGTSSAYAARVFYDDGIVDIPFGGEGLLLSRSEDNLMVETRSGSDFAIAHARVQLADAASDEGASIHTRGRVTGSDTRSVYPTDDSTIVLEFAARMSAIGVNNVRLFAGFHDEPDIVFDADYGDPAVFTMAGFRKNSGDTNWIACTTDTGDPQIDTGVPPVADAWQTFRVEIHGVNTPLGVLNSAQTVRYFIDGVLEHEEIMAVALATLLSLGFHAEANNTGPSAIFNFDVSPVRLSVVPFATSYELSQ